MKAKKIASRSVTDSPRCITRKNIVNNAETIEIQNMLNATPTLELGPWPFKIFSMKVTSISIEPELKVVTCFISSNTCLKASALFFIFSFADFSAKALFSLYFIVITSAEIVIARIFFLKLAED